MLIAILYYPEIAVLLLSPSSSSSSPTTFASVQIFFCCGCCCCCYCCSILIKLYMIIEFSILQIWNIIYTLKWSPISSSKPVQKENTNVIDWNFRDAEEFQSKICRHFLVGLLLHFYLRLDKPCAVFHSAADPPIDNERWSHGGMCWIRSVVVVSCRLLIIKMKWC